MLPVLLRLGPLELSSFGVCLAVGFILASFIVWRSAKNFGIEDEKILDHLIITACTVFIGARIGYGLEHFELFAPNLLRLAVIWRFPGFSYLGALAGGLLALFFYSKRQKLKLYKMSASYAKSLGVIFFFSSLAIFLDGTVVGKEASGWFLGMPAVGASGLRHPVGLYGMLLAMLVQLFLIIMDILVKRFKENRECILSWSTGIVAGLALLILAFFREDLLYLGGFSLEIITSILILLLSVIGLFLSFDGVTLMKDGLRKAKLGLKKKERSV